MFPFGNLELTVDTIYKELLEKLTRDQRIHDVSAHLLAIKGYDEKVLYVYSLINSYKIVPLIIKVDKCEFVSTYYRNLGNRFYQRANLYEAWQYYNMALSFAPLLSDTYSLAVSNRSAVLAALKKYKACIKDIDMIFTLRYPGHLRDKLLKRKKQCEEALTEIGDQRNSDDENEDVAEILKLKSFRNERYVDASAKLSVKYTEEMGRHVVAKEDIKVGEVLVEEDPYVQVLLKSQYYFACDHCFNRTPNLYPCAHCCLTMYCQRSCVENSWDEYHSYECPIRASLVKQNFSKLELLAVRITLKAQSNYSTWQLLISDAMNAELRVGTDVWGHIKSNNSWVYASKYYPAIHTLATNIEKRDVSDIFQKSVSAALLLHAIACVSFLRIEDPLLQLRAKKLTAEMLLRHIMTAPTNMHGITTNVENDVGHYVEEYNIGSAPYAFLSLINHSCSPNVVRFSKLGSGKMFLIALRPIKKGMQIFDNYGYAEEVRDEEQVWSRVITACEPTEASGLAAVASGWRPNKKAHHAVHTKEERQAILKSQYKFTCLCEACVDDWPLYQDLPNADLPADIIGKKNKFLSSGVIESLQKADKETALKSLTPLCELAMALDPYIPCKEAAECQEALKQCYTILCGVVPHGYSKIIEWSVPPPRIAGLPITSRFYTGTDSTFVSYSGV